MTRRQVLKAGAVGAGAALLPLAWSASPASAAAPPEVGAADGLALWYTQSAGTDWLRALPIGNGRLGAMVFGNVDVERLQLNEDTIWAGGPYDQSNPRGAGALAQIRQLVFAGQWGQAQTLIDQNMLGIPAAQLAYQIMGNLRLTFAAGSGGVSDYSRFLDLSTAVTAVSYLQNGVRFRREVIASAPDQVIAVRLTADRAGQLTFSAKFDSPQRVTVSSPDAATVAIDGISGDQRGLAGKVKFYGLARVVADGGTVSSSGGTLQVRSANSVTLLVSIGTSYVNYRDTSGDYQGKARASLTAAAARTWDDLRGRHVADYQRLFGRTTLDLGRTAAADQPTDVRIAQHASTSDPQFSALLFQYGRYLLISSSRPGTQPANLQGIWNDSLSPSWDSKYTLNANLPMNYWPADTTNLAECYEPVFGMIRELAVTGARTAQVQYGAGGWVTHHNTDAWRGSSVVDFAAGRHVADRRRLAGDHDLGPLPVHRRHSTFLQANYPAMKGAAQFFLDALVQEPVAGVPGHQPVELAGAQPPLRRQRVRRADDGQPDPARPVQRRRAGRPGARRRRRLPDQGPGHPRPAPADEGRLARQHPGVAVRLGRDRSNHRHVSHLYGLHPSNQITKRGTPTLYTAARRTLELRGDDGTGWSLAWKINYWARLEEGTRAHDLLRLLVTTARLAPNMFDLHPPFQIDGNFGATSGIAEMLLQSHNGELHVLPALPSAWPSGQVQGLRGRGGYTVGAKWGGGQPDEATVRFDRDGTVKVRGRFLTGTFTVTDTTSGSAVTVTKPESDAIALPGLAGRTYRIVGQAQQQPPPSGYVRIGNVTTGLVLDSGGTVASGANLKQWNWDGSNNLQWQLVDLGSGWYRIVNRTNGMVLDSWGATANGAVCRQSAWNGGTNQQWRLNDNGSGRFQIINRGTGTALDGMGNATAGSTVGMWTPNTSTNNLWTVTTL